MSVGGKKCLKLYENKNKNDKVLFSRKGEGVCEEINVSVERGVQVMEVILDCFFDKVFAELERGSLIARYKRRSMVEHLSTIIEGCIRGHEIDPQDACRRAVLTAIRYHEKSYQENGTVCLMGKYHNILYVAAKLCFDWQLKDSATVACLLDNIFHCEKTFERLLVGAIFGTRAPFFIAGWKSDFLDQEENVRAMVYFFDHAGTAALEYPSEHYVDPVRFIDIPIESCGHASPMKIVLQTGAPDILHIFLRFGAIVSEDAKTSGLENLLERLADFNRVYPFNLVACLKLLLRVVIRVRLSPETSVYVCGSNVERDTFLDRFPHFIKDGLVPESRCGLRPPELKHLCRCAIRYRLWQNYQLPAGIRRLPVPDTLQKYLDLFED